MEELLHLGYWLHLGHGQPLCLGSISSPQCSGGAGAAGAGRRVLCVELVLMPFGAFGDGSGWEASCAVAVVVSGSGWFWVGFGQLPGRGSLLRAGREEQTSVASGAGFPCKTSFSSFPCKVKHSLGEVPVLGQGGVPTGGFSLPKWLISLRDEPCSACWCVHRLRTGLTAALLQSKKPTQTGLAPPSLAGQPRNSFPCTLWCGLLAFGEKTHLPCRVYLCRLKWDIVSLVVEKA